MLKELISNAAILVVFMFLAGEVFKDNRLKPTASFKTRLFGGLLAGVLGSILMVFSVSLPSNVIIDLRQFALIVIAIHGGFFPTIIAGIVISMVRVIYFGIGHNSLVAAMSVMIISIICAYISTLKIKENIKWITMIIASMVNFTIFIIINLKDTDLVIRSLIYFYIITCIVGLVIAYLSKHITLSNSLFEKYKTESTKDYLTGFNNVRSFDLRLNNIINKAKTKGKRFTLIMLDIDHFKKINDTYGHAAGDNVLKELAQLISESCESAESISRIGGEEFCIILSDLSIQLSLEAAERIKRAVENHTFTEYDLRVTVSIGLSIFPDTVNNVEDLKEEADKALYDAKRSGRNRVSLNIQL